MKRKGNGKTMTKQETETMKTTNEKINEYAEILEYVVGSGSVLEGLSEDQRADEKEVAESLAVILEYEADERGYTNEEKVELVKFGQAHYQF